MTPLAYLADLLPLAVQAFAHTSHSPEARGQQTVDQHSKELVADLALIRALPLADVEAEATTYEARYRQHLRAWLTAHGNCVSTLVAGGSNFNTRRARKANNREHARLQEMLDWRAKALTKIQHQAVGPRTPESELEKAQKNLADREAKQARMKATNVAVRSKAPSKRLQAMGLTEAQAEKMIAIGGYPEWELGNNNAQIRRLRSRVTELTQKVGLQGLKDVVVAEFEGGELIANYTEDRVQLRFDGKPSEALRKTLKSRGFRWAHSLGVWQRLLNDASFWVAADVTDTRPQVAEFLKKPLPVPEVLPKELHELVPLAAQVLPQAWAPHAGEYVAQGMPGKVLDVIEGALLYCGTGASADTPELLAAGHHLVGALPDANSAQHYGISPELITRLTEAVKSAQHAADDDF